MVSRLGSILAAVTKSPRSVIVLLIVTLGLVSIARADCPHCYDIVKVRAEFRDGTVRNGFYEHHSSVVPIVTDADGVKRIAFDQSNPNFPQVSEIRLIDTVYQFPRITNCTTPRNIHKVAVSALKRLVYLGKVAYGGAGKLNVFDTSIVRLLAETPIARFDTTYSLSEIIYLSYNPTATEQDLRHLGEILGRPGSFDVRLRVFAQQMEDLISGSSSPKVVVGQRLRTKAAALPRDEWAFEQYAAATPVGSYFKAIADNLRYRGRALFAIRQYVESSDAKRLDADLRQICDSAKCTFPDAALRANTADPLALVAKALDIVRDCLSLERTLGTNYQAPLVDSGIVYIENPFD